VNVDANNLTQAALATINAHIDSCLSLHTAPE
jgi:hypothetical protein